MRLWDLGYSAWLWLDVGNAEYSPDEQLRRLSTFAEAYGADRCSTQHIAGFMLARQASLNARAKMLGNKEMADWAAAASDWTLENIVKSLLPITIPE